SYSDFSFEIKVLKLLNDKYFECNHSGTYKDPNTKKHREFDIRAINKLVMGENLILRLCLAVECKNIRKNNPLVIHCLPRLDVEAYQQVILVSESGSNLRMFDKRVFEIKNEKPLDDNCFYEVGEPVGKSCDQIGRKKDGEIINNDSQAFDKISQAINSAYDMARESFCIEDKDTHFISFILPVLVVPNNRIWSITYDKLGRITSGPELVDSISYYIDHTYQIIAPPPNHIGSQEFNYKVSHLEIVTLDSFIGLIEKHFTKTFTSVKARSYMKKAFPRKNFPW
ncbi:MAG: hypothetical protein GY730_05910, partial [bacterium]|nr:hypothetical protein [bacterium]